MSFPPIGHFEVTAKLGEGGMGVVYKARDPRLNRTVAIKSLPPSIHPGDDQQRRFLQEAQTAGALNHPNIVTIHDLLVENDVFHIVMEFVDGQTLDQMQRSRPLPWRDVLRIAIEVAAGLEAAHAAGVIHRDLKPGNIMFTQSGRVKILDFGLAKVTGAAPSDETQLAPLTEQGSILGTISYMSPEQAEGKQIDARSDIFSFGAVLYEMLTGQRAFKGETKISTITAILRDEPSPFSGEVPREFERLVNRCLRKDPARRYQSIADVKLALEDIKEDSESLRTSAVTPPAPKRASRWPWAAALVAVVAIGAAGWWLLPRLRSRSAMVIKPLVTGHVNPNGASFSPDGKMLAFTSAGEDGSNRDIYVKLVDAGQSIRLTQSPETDHSPIWLPDGKSIIFTRSIAGNLNLWQVLEIPALGGAERRVTDGIASDLAADGSRLLVRRGTTTGSPGGWFIVNRADGTERRLTQFQDGRAEGTARFSRDGRSFDVIRSVPNSPSKMIRISLDDGSETVIPIAGLRTHGLGRPIPGTSDLILSGTRPDRNLAELFRVPETGGIAELLPFGEAVTSPNVSLDGKQVVFVRATREESIVRVPAWPEPLQPVQPEPLFQAAAARSAEVSPDGALLASSDGQQNATQIVLRSLAGGSPRTITKLLRTTVGSPRWSPDGKMIAFDARPGTNPEVFTISAAGGEPLRLTNEGSEDVVPDWAPDGQSIYFTSDRSGRMELWRMPAAGGPASQITRNGAFYGRFSPDGKWLYYLRSRTGGGLYRSRPDGSGEEFLLPKGNDRNWVALNDGIYFLDTGVTSSTISTARPGIARFYRFATRKLEDLGFTTPKAVFANGITLSPDRKWLYYTQIDRNETDLMIADGFRD